MRLAAIGALAVALLLSGCGRKGPLDLPPGASNSPAGAAPLTPEQLALTRRGYDDTGKPIAPPGAKRPLPMDVLID